MASQVSIILQQSPAELSALLEDDTVAAGNTLLADLFRETQLKSVEILRSIHVHASECFFQRDHRTARPTANRTASSQ